eukprot:NODE_891_length_3400_cov_1.050591.p2 type:complete len:211 gc:universal NODE_891_length_3400_cov_1.050591:2564-1932(-)
MSINSHLAKSILNVIWNNQSETSFLLQKLGGEFCNFYSMTASYERVPDYEEANVETPVPNSQPSSSPTQSAQSVQAVPVSSEVFTSTHEDSVFSNLPTYADIAKDPTPEYEDEGLEVGDLTTFVLSALCTMVFQIIGFMLCFMFSTSHASRLGAMAGLGINIFQFAVYFRERHMRDSLTASFAYLIMLGGIAVTFESLYAFIKIRRLQRQ